MKRFQRGMAFLAVCALLLCACAYADSLADWAARYNAAAASAGLAPIADVQNIGDGAYGISLDDGGMLAIASDDSTIGGVIITGISSWNKLALVCGAALYACDSTLTVEAAMEKMAAFINGVDAGSEHFESSWVSILETNGTETVVALISQELFAALPVDGLGLPILPEVELPSDSEATPSEAPVPGTEAPSETPVLPTATPDPVLHKI